MPIVSAPDSTCCAPTNTISTFFDAEQQAAQRVVAEVQPRDARAGIDRIDEQVLPRAFALGFLAEQLHSLKRANRFEKVRIEPRVRRDALVAAPAQRLQQRQCAARRRARTRPSAMPASSGEYTKMTTSVVNAIAPSMHCGHDAAGDEFLHRLQRSEARDHVADVAALEVVERQPDQMEEQPRAEREVQPVGEIQAREAAQRFRRDVEQREQQEADAEQRQHVDVLFHQHVVDDELHVRWRREREQLDEARTVPTAARWGAATLRCRATATTGSAAARAARARMRASACSSSATPVKCLRQFGERKAPLSDGRIVDFDVPSADALQHHEVVEVPVQNRRTRDVPQFVDVDAQRACG